MEALVFIALGATMMLAFVWARRRYFGFLAQAPEDYREDLPTFDLRQHLNGPLLCEGIIYGPTGRVTSRFVANIEVTWDGNVGTMTEEFRYQTGATQSRHWTLTLGTDGSIRAEAPDVVGVGRGMQMGSGVRLNYRIRLPEDAGGHVLNTTDWMYLVENGSIINHSQFRKYGITVAELVATMRKKETP